MEIDTIKISELAEGTQINNDSILVYNLNGQTKKITFQNLKNAVISTLASEVSQLDADLEAEVTARTAADATLAGNITAEATARADADTSLAGDISAEAAARTAADSSIINTLADKADYIGKTYTVVDSVFTSGTGKEVTIPSDGWYYVLAKNGGTPGQLSIYIHTDISLADYLCGVVAATSNFPDSYIRTTTPMIPFKSGTKVTIRAFFTDTCELRRMT